MLILSEENERLKGTKYKIPKHIENVFFNIVKNSIPSKDNKAYIKAKNVIKGNGYVTMEWLKNMKHYFTKHKDETDQEFINMGGYVVKTYVDDTLERLTSAAERAEKSTNATKPRGNASNLAGFRGEKSSQTLSVVKSLMSDIIPRFESTQRKKNIIITEEQLNNVREVLNKNKNR